MTLWHASTELHATSGSTAVAAKTAYLATSLMGRLEAGLGLDRAELDTSG